MAEPAYTAVRVSDLECEDGWSPIRQALGVRSFVINAWRGREVGAAIIPAHDELPSRHEELYVVTDGHASFTVGDATGDAPAGTLVYVRDPALIRGAVAAEANTTIIAVGGEPGCAYAPRSWETSRDVVALFEAGRYAQAKHLLAGRSTSTPTPPSCSTTSPAPRLGWETPTPPSSISRPRSPRSPRSSITLDRTAIWRPRAATRASPAAPERDGSARTACAAPRPQSGSGARARRRGPEVA